MTPIRARTSFDVKMAYCFECKDMQPVEVFSTQIPQVKLGKCNECKSEGILSAEHFRLELTAPEDIS